jgi:mRNA interferase RelE/StbE
MSYRVEIAPRAAKQIRSLPRSVQDRIFSSLTQLETNPRPPGCRQLAGDSGFYRIRTGDYRIIYTIEDDVLLVLIVKIGHRRDIYR